MAVTNSLVKQVDLPVWEWLRFCPIATAAIGSTCLSENPENTRYLYYLGATFWRYDTKMDSWQQLATPNIAAVTASSLRYSAYGGYRGNVLDATSNTIQIAGLQGNIFNNKRIRITFGKGAGQRRTVTGASLNTIHDQGLITAVSTNVSMSDSTKKWEINQYIGYSVRIVYGTGQSQVRKILYNDATTLYFYDANYHALEPWNNIGWASTTPYAIPVTTAGSQAFYYIESTVLTIDENFDVIPDETSSYVIETGGIFCFSSAAASPFSSMQYYDIASDTWITKTPLGGATAAGLLIAAYGTDFAIERTGEHGGIKYTADTVFSSTSRSITTTGTTYAIDDLRNLQVRIISGTGMGQRFRIIGNTTNSFEIPRSWETQPDSSSIFEIWPNTDEIYLAGGALSSVFKYSVENDYWYTGNDVDFGQCRNISVGFPGQEAYAMSTGVRNTNGITSLNSTPTNPGSNYVVGDIVTISTGGSGGKARVESVSGSGVVTSVSLYAAGSSYTTGTGKATTGGSGTGLSLNILTVGVVGRITTVQNTNLYSGDTVTISGCTEAAWNGTYNILAIDSLTTFDIPLTATGNAAASNSQSTSTIVDATKKWEINEHVGKIVILNVVGTSPTNQIRRIVSNTATVLTLQSTITAGANGTSRYTICQPEAFGKARQWSVEEKKPSGYATSGNSYSLTDETKNWINNQWQNYKFRISSGMGVGNEITITASTYNTLFYSAQTFSPDSTTRYRVMDSFGLISAVTNTTNATITDGTKNWAVNQWAGRRIHITSGAGAGDEKTITSNTPNVLTLSGVFTNAPDANSTYTILEVPARGAATTLLWTFGTSGNTAERGRYIFCPRGGGSNLIDRYDIRKNEWDLSTHISPHTEIFTTGTMYAYDGENGIVIHRGDATSTLRTFRINIDTLEVEGLGMPPYAHGTPLIGNRMEVLSTEDNLKYLYIMRHTGTEMWRTLLF